MASRSDNDNLEVQEIVVDIRNERENSSAMGETGETDREEQDMEIDTGGEQADSEGIHESNVPDHTEIQSLMQNATPTVARSIQVLGLSAVNSPDEFQNKPSKPASKNTSKVKISRSPIKSPEKDDDVSFVK